MSKKVSGWPLIVPKEVDTSITGDQVMEALAADVESGDNRKVLTAIYGGIEGEETGRVEWARADHLPVIGEGDAGKVLTVNAGETGTEWAVPESWKISRISKTVIGSRPSGWSQDVAEFSANLSNVRGYKVLGAFVEVVDNPTTSYPIEVFMNATPYSPSGSYYPSAMTIPLSGKYNVYFSCYNPSADAVSATVSVYLLLSSK